MGVLWLGLGLAAVSAAILDTYQSALENQVSRRCQLARMLVDDGWFPEAWERRMEVIRSASAPGGT